MSNQPSSWTGLSAASAGFSLLELIVVMGLMALAIGMTASGLRTFGRGVQLEPLALSIAADLKRARTSALTAGQPVIVAIEPALHAYRVGRSSPPIHLPAGAVVSLATPRYVEKPARAGQITFFPDGSSSGGQLTISAGTGNAVRLYVEWATGVTRIEVPTAGSGR